MSMGTSSTIALQCDARDTPYVSYWMKYRYRYMKGYKRLWVLRRLKILGASEKELLDVYQKQVRSVLELAVPVWQPALTTQEKKQIEKNVLYT